MNALDELFMEIEHHAVLRGHANLIRRAKEQHRNMESQIKDLQRELEEYKSLSGVIACAYCGHISPKGDNMAVLEHTMSCELRPEKKILEKAFEIEDRLLSGLDHVATKGYHLDGCDVCLGIRKALELWHTEIPENGS